jgi:hypothetical protein
MINRLKIIVGMSAFGAMGGVIGYIDAPLIADYAVPVAALEVWRDTQVAPVMLTQRYDLAHGSGTPSTFNDKEVVSRAWQPVEEPL